MSDLFSSWLPGIQQFVEERIMVDTVRIYKEVPGPIDAVTGQYTPTLELKYEGAGMILPPGSISDGDDYFICGVPPNVLNVERGDVVEVLAATYDPLQLGRSWDVIDPMCAVAIGYRYIQLADRATPGE